ncbi:hypothetical protein OLX02_04925 [Novosphingobium sp. KCTC 2891]|uniref:hypothetical protein n=1 Tax=Novosphingobium sp. KCTC 2891 TaxID=2989730 RepID=UPI0022226078|nr:hypothetical protein [Novosphingobium sp. KCTC 2891]MCW1382157.1 hypothetical protein [Novosphingobium sp. KCTC 2891]
MSTDSASLILTEMREFAGFTAGEQRYIRRSLDIGLGRQDALRIWARTPSEATSIRDQYAAYQDLASLRRALPEDFGAGGFEGFMGKLLGLSVFDLAQDHIASFSAYRFLYERLLGAEVRPWLPAAFCGAAALPQVRPDRRKGLLQSISEAAATAAGWSARAPRFFPEFVEVEAAA